LENIYNEIIIITEIVSAIAIVVSIIYLGIQFRKNTKATRSETATNTIGAMNSWYITIGNNEQSSTLFWNFLANPDSLSATQRFQAIMNFHGLWLTYQTSYYLAKEGTLDIRILETLIETVNGVKDQPGFHLYWKTRKSLFFQEFQDYIDKVVKSDKVTSKGLYKQMG